jgi:hypothetical protein
MSLHAIQTFLRQKSMDTTAGYIQLGGHRAIGRQAIAGPSSNRRRMHLLADAAQSNSGKK